MAAEHRKLLEQLMGDANLLSGPTPASSKLPITDAKICRSYLVGTCPHDLFTNTKQDLGPCPKQHNEALKNEYQDATEEQKRKWGFEFDYLRDMGRFVTECDRRIEGATRRLERTPEEAKAHDNLIKQIASIQELINLELMECQALGEGDQVNQSYKQYCALGPARVQLSDLERELKSLSDTSGPSGHQKLQVCDTCGAYLSRLDNDRRLADHFFGKMHLGYSQMRKTYKTLQEELKGKQPPVREWDNPAGSREGHEGGYGERGFGDRGFGGRGGYRGGGGGYGRGGGYRGGRGRW